jgi:hypothetical protein
MSGPGHTGLPRPSTTRFILLILVVCAGASFASYWWLIAERGFWLTEQDRCLAWLRDPSAGSADVSGFNRCITSLGGRQEGVVLLGPITFVVVTLLATAALVVISLRLYRRRRPSDRLARCFESCLSESSLPQSWWHRRPRLAAVRWGAGGEARVFGLYPRYWVLVDGLNSAAADDQRLAVLLRHELAHLRAGDVDRALIARSAWALFSAGVAPALVISIARQGGSAWAQLGSRLLVLLVLLHLTYRSLLRAREYEADLAADAAQARSASGPAALTMASLIEDQAANARSRSRSWQRGWVLAFLRAHPRPADRLAVLHDPRLAARLSLPEFLSIGLAVGLIFQELAFAIDAVLPAAPDVAYWITGAIMAIPVSLVTVSAVWRHERSGPGPLRPRTVVLAGALLGLGLLVGSQLSPRAAADWGSVQLAVSPTAPSDLALTSASPLTVAALAVVVVVGGSLFLGWATALARLLAPSHLARGEYQASRGRLARWPYRAGVALAVLVLAIPLGSWFVLCLLAADSRVDSTAEVAADLLQGEPLFAGLAATAAIAVLSLLAAGAWRRERVTTVLRRTAAVSCALAVLPFAAWGAGAAIQDWFTAAPAPLASYGGASLPLLPPSVAQSHTPLGAGITCWIFAQVPISQLTDPGTLALLGGLLRRTPDPPLRLLGDEFTRVARVPPSQLARNMTANVWLATAARCDALPS